MVVKINETKNCCECGSEKLYLKCSKCLRYYCDNCLIEANDECSPFKTYGWV